MNIVTKLRQHTEGNTFTNERKKLTQGFKGWVLAILRFLLIVGIAYVILGPVIGMVAQSFFSNADKYSPMVYLIPQNPTLERYSLAITRMDYFATLGRMMLYVVSLSAIQVAVCSLVGYGFARYKFPLKNLLFACVIVMIVLPLDTIMLPVFMTFQDFDPIGVFPNGLNLLRTPWPMFIMTVTATGLRAGLFIYIFNQFFRNLPKEIEEAAAIDGAGTFYTYARVMMPNAMPSVITVLIFSLVWQYNDTFFANLFNLNTNMVLSKHITTLQATITNLDRILDPSISSLYVYAAVVLAIVPLVLLYVLLQKQFIEGVERSGIVG